MESLSKAQALSHVLWMGGSPCAGKSSIARILAGKYGVTIYSCDDAYDAHLQRAHPEKHPHLWRSSKITWDEVWMHPVEHLLTREVAFYKEEFEMVMDDLISLPQSPILAEGTCLIPPCVAPLLLDPRQAIWLVPTEEFQRKHYPERGPWVQEVLAQCSQPHEAFENWMGRDAAFARWVAQEAGDLGLGVIWVDGSLSIDELAAIVERHFQPFLGGPA